MNPIKAIRERLGLTQAALAAELGCSQSNVSFYEKGQTVPQPMAKALITTAARLGLAIGYEHVYGDEELPPAPVPEPEAKAA
ncbi:helix-turn-helix domain-containing protein [Variovorax atrisoli]|uniref:helix-turn-helix domain-containing protein n=1 Tax=Variovorax atrisoli TaxID=3394203 RepID=UPI000478440B|nr:helix-turn-helix transcriptional regulator [Variovorax paradoxus]